MMTRRSFHFFLSCALHLVAAAGSAAQDDIRKDGPIFEQMQYGPFVSATIDSPWPNGNVTNKGVVVKLGKAGEAAICFDLDLLRVAAGWTGGLLNLKGVAYDGSHGPNPSVKGTQIYGNKPGPGWARNGEFADPRAKPFGPLPSDWAKYRGLYVHGDQVVFTYSVGDSEVLELPGFETRDALKVFTRTIELGKSALPRTVVIAEVEADGASGSVQPLGQPATGVPPNSATGNMAVLVDNPTLQETRTAAAVINAPPGATWSVVEPARIHLNLPPASGPSTLKVLIWSGAHDQLAKFADYVKDSPAITDLRTLTRGGPGRWSEKVVTKGELGKATGAYVVDTLTVPEENPWKSWMRLGGLDFFSDGRAAVCTWNGDVWIVSGIDETLEKVEWKRFAAGLFQTLGLRIVDDTIYTLGREGITRLHDLNKDGEADWYESFNSDVMTTPGFHEFAFDLQTDPEGNFYFAKGGPVQPGGRGWQQIADHHGAVLQVSKDGKKLEVFATGLRAPNGMAVGPRGEVTVGDNEGTWMPACRISLLKKGGFVSVVDLAHREQPPGSYGPPICFLPRNVDNSSGGQIWVTSDRWGPFKGQMLHLSYGTCSLFKVMMETVGEDVQGGVVKFPLKFDSGIMRGRFNPRDGQLYLVGLKGWQTTAAKLTAFHRVRYTEKPVNMPTELHVAAEGIRIGFTSPVDAATAADPESYDIEQWNYIWSKEYGSPEVSVKDPAKKQHDPVAVKSAKLSADGKMVMLEIPGLQPSMQMRIKMDIDAADGSPMAYEIHNTINKIGTAPAAAEANPAPLPQARR